MIWLDKIHQTYGTGQSACHALRGVTLEIQQGTFTVLAGPSGSGKTSLLNIIASLDKPSAGTVSVGGRDLATLSETEISDMRLRQIGFVFQDSSLVPVLSAAENIEFPLLFRREIGTAERRRRVAIVLEGVGLAGKQDRRPNELSGGERQRVGLARALAGTPAIVLADEPTANLDQETGIGIIELMRSLNRKQGMTFLYASHDPRLIALADNVLKLRDGKLEAASTE